MLLYKQIINFKEFCKDNPDKKIDKNRDRKPNSRMIEEASDRFADLLISQIEINKAKNHSVKGSGLK